jgi:hypothetical protein
VSGPQINLDIGTGFTTSSVGSAPNHQKYPVDDINEPTSCTLLYVKGRMLRTIEVNDAFVMATRIMQCRHVPSECAVVRVTMIREGREFEDLDYPDEEEEIEKLKDAKGNLKDQRRLPEGGGVNRCQSKFLEGTRLISRNQPDAPLF